MIDLKWSVEFNNQLYESSSRPLLTENGIFISGDSEHYYDLISGRKSKIGQYHDVKKQFVVSSTRNELVVFDLQNDTYVLKIKRERGPYLGHHAPTITSDTLLADISSPDRRYSVLLYDLKNKEELWSKAIDFPVIAPPVIDKGHVYCATLNGLVVLELLSGEVVKWIFKGERVLSSIEKFGNSLHFVTNKKIVSYNTGSGHPDWFFSDLSLKAKNYDFVLRDTSLLLIANGVLYCISAETGELKWRNSEVTFDQENNIVASDKHIFCYTNVEEGSRLSAVNIETGALAYMTFTSEEFLPDINHPTNLNSLDREVLVFYKNEVGKRIVAFTYNRIILFSVE